MKEMREVYIHIVIGGKGEDDGGEVETLLVQSWTERMGLEEILEKVEDRLEKWEI